MYFNLATASIFWGGLQSSGLYQLKCWSLTSGQLYFNSLEWQPAASSTESFAVPHCLLSEVQLVAHSRVFVHVWTPRATWKVVEVVLLFTSNYWLGKQTFLKLWIHFKSPHTGVPCWPEQCKCSENSTRKKKGYKTIADVLLKEIY